MTLLNPIAGYLVGAEYAEQVVGPAYDVLRSEERRLLAASNPLSFLNVTRSEGDLPEGTSPHEARRKSAELVEWWIGQGVFEPWGDPSLFLYRLESEDHTQIGVVADIEVERFEDGTVLRHELTRPAKERELLAFLETVRVNSSPVALTYRTIDAVDAVVSEAEASEPKLSFVTGDGVRHTVWTVEEDAGTALQEAFRSVGALYITDGHHRAAASRLWKHTAGRVLCVLFPSDQLRILPYNRCASAEETALIEAVRGRFDIERVSGYAAARPEAPGQFAVFAPSGWLRLSRRQTVTPRRGKVEDIAVSILHREILAPLLETEDPDFDDRLSYLPGSGGPQALEERCRQSGALGFLLPPTSLEDVMAVSEAGNTMPPKSTWFDPKARSGIFLVPR